MFNLEDFRENQELYRIVERLNKYFEKNKTAKIQNTLENFDDLLVQDKLVIPSTFILSILAEERPQLINDDLLKKIESLINCENPKITLNALSILGFKMLSKPALIELYLPIFFQNLKESNPELRENIYYFIQAVFEINSQLICKYKQFLLDNLTTETEEDNKLSLISFLNECKDFSFEQLFDLKDICKTQLKLYFPRNDSAIFKALRKLVINCFPFFDREEFWESLSSFEKRFEDHIVAKKHGFKETLEQSDITLNQAFENLKDSKYIEKKLFFYIKQNKGKNVVHIYEFEREKLINFFHNNEKLSKKQLLEIFEEVVENEIELRALIKMLIKLKQINGYYSLLGYFYPSEYISSEFLMKLRNKGVINLAKFDYLPKEFIKTIIDGIVTTYKLDLLVSKGENAYYSLKKIKEQINTKAAKKNSIDLHAYRERLSEAGFMHLIKSLPKDYLTIYHYGTQWLTNLGLINLNKEIENSKVLGYFSLEEVSRKLKINKLLVLEIFNLNIDERMGIFDNSGEKFYYSLFINQKIDRVKSIAELEEREKQINHLAKELNIERTRINTKINENLRLIGEEIKKLGEIKIKDYMEKSGMDIINFMKFIDDLGVSYLKKGDFLILDDLKIENAKKDIKQMLLTKTGTEDKIDMSTFDITPRLVKNFLKEMVSDGVLKGIFYTENEVPYFYSERGIRNLMLENRSMFCFYDFFSQKELTENEIVILRSILNNLLEKKFLKGTFDENNLTFFSSEVVFAQDYNVVLDEFEKIVNNYLEIFKSEFLKIKKILTKQNQTIFPQEIKTIQEIIDNINHKYVLWRSGIEAFVKNANNNLLRKQGLSAKRYKTIKISSQKKDELKIFEEDPNVIDLLEKFNYWVKLLNNLEIKYGNVIFYQKRLLQEPDNDNNLKKVNDLLDELQLK